MKIETHGAIGKLVKEVDQITFSGAQSIAQGQTVVYITERCVFELHADGLRLVEVAPGVNVESDILNKMAFRPIIADDLKSMSSSHFVENMK
jgi:acyl CoA:acetate/3-ketoacid CoA transferase